MKIDKKDMHILEVLKENSNYTIRQIAKKVALPIATVHHRIKKLKEKGIIKKYTIELDYEKLQQNFVAYVLINADLHLLKKKNKTQYDLAKELKKFPFVEKADIIAGGADIIATVRVKDVKEFDKALLGKIQLLEGISKTQSLIVIHRT